MFALKERERRKGERGERERKKRERASEREGMTNGGQGGGW
jgi:hypothetical protein